MRPLLSILLAPALLAAEDSGKPASDIAPDHQLPAVSLMPVGSVLKKVMIPRYDLERKLTAVLRSDELTVIDTQTVEGKDVSVELFNPNRTTNARIDLKLARFDQKRGTLESRKPVEMVSTDFSGKGSGLSYTYQQGQGFLLGPVQTRFFAKPPKTSMNFPSAPRSAATALAATLLSLPVFAERPPRLTPEERAGLVKDATSLAPEQKKAAAEAKDLIEADRRVSSDANNAVAAFLKQAALTAISIEASPESAPGSKPLEVHRTPQDTVIESDDGMYFDAEKGLLVYLKNVRLDDPRFTLTGANELKIIMAKKPPAKPAEGEKKDKAAPVLGGNAEGFGDVERIIATGAVKLVQKPTPGKDTVEAFAAVVTYNVKTGEIILNDGYPWVKQGDKTFRAKEKNLYLRIQKDFSFVTEGNWDTSGRLDGSGAKGGAEPNVALLNAKDWENIALFDLIKKTDFRITPDPKLPNLLVLGDSISIGYTQPLRNELAGQYNVQRPLRSNGAALNCRSSTETIGNLNNILGKTPWNVIAFNSGLWDAATAPPEDSGDKSEVGTPLETYKKNIETLVGRLKATGAKLVWVSTTSPREAKGLIPDARVKAQNDAAREIMARHGIPVCDLYSTTASFAPALRADHVHFTPAGSKVLAAEVKKAVLSNR